MAESGARPLYAVLGLPPDASAEAVKQAYRRLALQNHPDKCRGTAEETAAAEAAFARIAFAYEVLGNEQRRKRYDLSGEVPQSDTAGGRSAQETFLKEYMKSAPQTSRAASQADYSLHSLENYEILEVDGRDVPEYMRGIVARGLGYLAAVLEGMEDKDVVLLRHFVMDQMYALLAYTPPLDADAFSGDRGYVITYYDAPLQAGIQPSWSDQNGPSGRSASSSKPVLAELRAIDSATIERRRLAALEWVAPNGAVAAAAPVAAQERIAGEGFSPERLRLAAKALARREPDLGSFTSSRLRKELEDLLGLDAGGLQSLGSSQLMGIVLEVSEELEEEDEGEEPQASSGLTAPPQSRIGSEAESPQHLQTQTSALAPTLSPEPCCGGVPFFRRVVDDARRLLTGKL
eukprot:gb/GFBE01044322.1/.p1 GENE.gb/GFBE01044322.1/~~gb/GFBE01044322.1/.p1  ORF type:complete len:404 (+),score=89.48 gb/GFBE01044322.1/:1-1212(+)